VFARKEAAAESKAGRACEGPSKPGLQKQAVEGDEVSRPRQHRPTAAALVLSGDVSGPAGACGTPPPTARGGLCGCVRRQSPGARRASVSVPPQREGSCLPRSGQSALTEGTSTAVLKLVSSNCFTIN